MIHKKKFRIMFTVCDDKTLESLLISIRILFKNRQRKAPPLVSLVC